MNRNRIKSPVLWTSLISALFLILKGLGIYEIDNELLSKITDIVLSILTAFGIINNPTNKTGF
jgi:phi LC3 family holin